MSWLFSRALVAEFSRATHWDGAPSAPLSVMPTPHKFWRNDKTMEPSALSRFGLTCAVLTDDRGADLLTWFRGASLARTSAWPARAPALTEHGAACGSTWRGSLARFDPASSTWKTAQPSLLGDLEECSVTWPRSGMTAGGLCWELPTAAPLTKETGSGLWLQTPIAAMARNTMRSPEFRKGRTPSPQEFVQKWPTPTVCGNYNRKGASATSGDGLATAVLKFPTPSTLGINGGSHSQSAAVKRGQAVTEVNGGSLNPTWVEWLMRWPIGWTDLKPLGTAKCPPALPRPGESLLAARNRMSERV